MLTLVDRGGRVIAQAEPRLDGLDRRSFFLCDVRGKRSLLHYFCESGLGNIWLNLGEVRLAGRLETRWQKSRRVWRVRLETPGAICTTDSSGAAGAGDKGCGHPSGSESG
jgi:hypothetical protein